MKNSIKIAMYTMDVDLVPTCRNELNLLFLAHAIANLVLGRAQENFGGDDYFNAEKKWCNHNTWRVGIGGMEISAKSTRLLEMSE